MCLFTSILSDRAIRLVGCRVKVPVRCPIEIGLPPLGSFSIWDWSFTVSGTFPCFNGHRSGNLLSLSPSPEERDIDAPTGSWIVVFGAGNIKLLIIDSDSEVVE